MSSSQHVNIPGYELVRELGVGGMATVFLAIQTSLDRKVALKVMRRNIDDVEKFERRFLMEGRTLAKLPHRNIVAVYDIVKGDAATYIAMEYLDGGTLHERMRDGLSLAEAVAIVVQIAGALQFAHDHAVIHRDLKPSNIMFRDESTPVLTDFGIAKQQDAQQTRLTQTGMLVGTPTYMSPEQINALEVDGRSDLYSLGVMFYELLTGKAPFAGDTPIAVLMAHLTTPPPPLPPAFADFQAVMDRMLAKNRDDRFANLKEFTKALKGVVINNETLWAKLQADPNQSSSEQLRALGFSISSQTAGDLQQPHAGMRRTGQAAQPSGRLPTPSSAATQVSAPLPTPAQRAMERSAPIVAPAEPPTAPPHNRAPLFAGLGFVAVLMIALGLWWSLRTPSEIDPKLKGTVDGHLGMVDIHIANKQLVQPLGENALETLRKAQELAPEYSETRKREQVLLKALIAEANAKLQQGNLDHALVMQNYAAGLAGDSTEVQALQKQIAEAKTALANADEVKRLLASAQAAMAAGRNFGADSTYLALNSAMRLAPKDPEVVRMRSDFMARLLGPIRTDIGAGRLEEAERKLAALESELGNDADWRQVQIDIGKAKSVRDLENKLALLYGRFDAQIRAGKLLQPQGDAAMETLSEIIGVNPNHGGLAQRRADLVRALIQAGERELTEKRASNAARLAETALTVIASDASALALKQRAEGELSANERQVAQTLAAAQSAVMARQLFAPAGKSARDLASAVLRLDANNAEAKKILTELPDIALRQAGALRDSGDLKSAQSLVQSAQAAYPGDARLNALMSELNQSLAGAEREAKRRAQIDEVLAVASAARIDPPAFGRAMQTVQSLLQSNARDVDAITARRRLLDALLSAAQSARQLSELKQFEPLLADYRTRFSNDSALPAATEQWNGIQSRLSEAEKQRLAESVGRLVLIAAPWGEVESVIDSASKQSLPLPAERTTPLVLNVPAGVYRVTFKHPGARSVTQVGELKAKSESQVVASFPALSKEEYLRRAGL